MTLQPDPASKKNVVTHDGWYPRRHFLTKARTSILDSDVDLNTTIWNAISKLYVHLTESSAVVDYYTFFTNLTLLELELKRARPSLDVRPLDTFERSLMLLRSNGLASPWLFDGAAGIGWLSSRLSQFVGFKTVGLASIDMSLIDVLDAYPSDQPLDLPEGALGLLVYGLTHPDQMSGDAIVGSVLDLLENRAHGDAQGSYWWGIRLRDDSDEFDTSRELGVAHGQAGIVAALSTVVLAEGAQAERAARILEPAVSWLIAHQSRLKHSIFSSSIETSDVPARDAWCIGDPGICLAFYQAADAMDSDELRLFADELRDRVIGRPRSASLVEDASLCHGSSFLAAFNSLLPPSARNEETTNYSFGWLTEVLQLVESGRLSSNLHTPEVGRTGFFTGGPDFLEGDVGVALALLTFVSDTRPFWTDLLLAQPVQPFDGPPLTSD